jgi:hypothetical protein
LQYTSRIEGNNNFEIYGEGIANTVGESLEKRCKGNERE